MKKILSRILLALNILLILFLLLLSCLMVYMTAAKPAEIFGHTAVLVEDAAGSGTLCIVDRHPAQMVPGDTLLLRREDNLLDLLLVDRNDGKQLYYKDDAGVQATLPVDDAQIQGRVTSENEMLGGFFSVVVRSENVKTTYICIGVGFLFCALAIFLVYFLSTKLVVPFAETAEDRELLREILEGDGEDDAEEDDGEDGESGEDAPSLPKPLNALEEDSPPAATPFPQLARLRRRRAQGDAQPEEAESPGAETYSIRLSGPPEKQQPEPPLPPGAVPIDLDETVEIKIYTPHSRKREEGPPTAAQRPEKPAQPAASPAPPASPLPPPAEEPQIVVHSPTDAYDLYDLHPNISEVLDDIERQFRDLGNDS